MDRERRTPPTVPRGRSRRIRSGLLVLLAAGVVACGADPTDETSTAGRAGGASGTAGVDAAAAPAHRGQVVSVQPITSVTADQARADLTQLGLDATTADHGFDVARLEYRTIGTAGDLVTASALLVVPTGAPRPSPLVVYGHGTITEAAAAPTSFSAEARPVAAAFASRGLALVAPDYLGWGASTEAHPYLHADSAAATMRDALIAARAWLPGNSTPVDERTFVTGFSQGGQAALALAEDLTLAPVPGLSLAGTAGVAGPYDLSGTQVPAVLDPARAEPTSSVVYVALLLTAYDRLYDLYDDPSDVFAAPYDSRLPGLLDGTRTADEVAAGLPDDPAELLTPVWRAQLDTPSGDFLAALQDNDTCDFRPASPVRLYSSAADRDVLADNDAVCRDRMRTAGGDAEIVRLGDLSHSAAAVSGLAAVAAWFDEERS